MPTGPLPLQPGRDVRLMRCSHASTAADNSEVDAGMSAETQLVSGRVDASGSKATVGAEEEAAIDALQSTGGGRESLADTVGQLYLLP